MNNGCYIPRYIALAVRTWAAAVQGVHNVVPTNLEGMPWCSFEGLEVNWE